MAKTPQQYYEELIANPKKQLDEKHTLRQQADAQQKAQINAAVDQSVQNATAQYEQRIAALPDESRAQFDANALDEAVSRTRVQEYLANMGMTDSGLTSSMATALSVQKGKADHQVRMNEQQQRQYLMAAIDQIVAEGETKKTESAMSIDAATRQWYDETNARLEESARSSAAEAYAADQEYAASQIEAQQEYDNQRRQYVQKQMMEGTTAEQAWANAYAVYPGQDQATNAYYELIRNGYTADEIMIYQLNGGGEAGDRAIADMADELGVIFAKSLTLDITGGHGTAWKSAKGDGKTAAEQLKKQVENSDVYKNMSPFGKEYAYAAAAGYMIAHSWHFNPRQVNKTNYDRLKEVCNSLGIDYEVSKAYYERAIKENGWEFPQVTG